jgi:hypothetical protein
VKLFLLTQKSNPDHKVFVWAESAGQAREVIGLSGVDLSWRPKDAFCYPVLLGETPRVVHVH